MVQERRAALTVDARITGLLGDCGRHGRPAHAFRPNHSCCHPTVSSALRTRPKSFRASCLEMKPRSRNTSKALEWTFVRRVPLSVYPDLLAHSNCRPQSWALTVRWQVYDCRRDGKGRSDLKRANVPGIVGTTTMACPGATLRSDSSGLILLYLNVDGFWKKPMVGLGVRSCQMRKMNRNERQDPSESRFFRIQ